MDYSDLQDDTSKDFETEPGTGKEMAGFSASAQKDKFLGGASATVTTINETRERTIPGTNQVEKLIADHFSSPDLWGKSRAAPQEFGLEPARNEWGDMMEKEKIVDDPSKTWLANIYGMRIVPDENATVSGAVKLEAVDLKVVTAIHQKLAETVLQSENIRIATPTTPPNPERGVTDIENNNYWLQMIKEGKWPVYTDADAPDGEPPYSSHDYGDYHLANFALFPREIQDMITDAATNELSWRTRWQNGEVQGNMKLLYGEDEHDDDPWASGFRGSKMHTNGILKIDNLTDIHSYLPLLAYVTDVADSPEHHLASVLEYAQQPKEDYDDPRYRASEGIREMRKEIGDMVNFNTRHRENRKATQEEVDEAFEKFKTGLVRVAHKIRGDTIAA